MDPLDILNLLRSALSLGTMIVDLGQRYDLRRGVREAAPRLASPQHRDLLTSEEGLELLGTLVIEEGLLHDLIAQLDDAQWRYRQALLHAETPEERRAADLRAEAEICEHLNRIKARNAGVLPLGELRAVWCSYGCADRAEPAALPEARL